MSSLEVAHLWRQQVPGDGELGNREQQCCVYWFSLEKLEMLIVYTYLAGPSRGCARVALKVAEFVSLDIADGRAIAAIQLGVVGAVGVDAQAEGVGEGVI